MEKVTRRQFLKGIGALAVSTLTGCQNQRTKPTTEAIMQTPKAPTLADTLLKAQLEDKDLVFTVRGCTKFVVPTFQENLIAALNESGVRLGFSEVSDPNQNHYYPLQRDLQMQSILGGNQFTNPSSILTVPDSYFITPNEEQNGTTLRIFLNQQHSDLPWYIANAIKEGSVLYRPEYVLTPNESHEDPNSPCDPK